MPKAPSWPVPSFSGSCPPPDWATGFSKVHPHLLSSHSSPLSSSFLPITLSSGTLYSRTPHGSHHLSCLVPMAGPASHPAQMSRAGRDREFCCILDGNHKAKSEEEIHLLVSDRVWIRTRNQWNHSGTFLPVARAVGNTWLFSLVVAQPRCPFLVITVQPRALLPQEALPATPLSDFTALPSLPCNSALITFTGACPPVRTHANGEK